MPQAPRHLTISGGFWIGNNDLQRTVSETHYKLIVHFPSGRDSKISLLLFFKTTMPFTSILPPRDRPQRTRGHALERLILNHLSLSSWLLIGCLFNSLILALTLSVYAQIPVLAALAILGVRLINTVLITYGLIKNPYLEEVIPHKYAAQIPDAYGGNMGKISDVPASERVVCFHLGAKFNHPAGIFAADARETGTHLSNMISELDDNMGSNGFLGKIQWQSYDERGVLETNFIAY